MVILDNPEIVDIFKKGTGFDPTKEITLFSVLARALNALGLDATMRESTNIIKKALESVSLLILEGSKSSGKTTLFDLGDKYGLDTKIREV